MKSDSNSVLLNGIAVSGRYFVVLAIGVAGFACGLVLLSFADDLLQYQARITERTALYLGLGFGLFSALVCMGAAYWLLTRRSR